MALPRLPKSFHSSLAQGAGTTTLRSACCSSTACRSVCSQSHFSSLAARNGLASASSLSGRTAASASPAGSAAVLTPIVAATSNTFHSTRSCMTSAALGRCRTVIRNKHQVAGRASHGTSTSSTGLSSSTNKRYSHVATASSSPSGHLSSLQQQQQHQAHPIHMSASAFPSMSAARTSSSSSSASASASSATASMSATAPSTSSVSPQTSPLFRMNNPASIQQPQARRRYSPQHFYQNRILDPYVNQAVNPITLRQLVFFGRNMQEDKLLKSANYVRTELPIRLAHRIRDFQNLPFIVGTNPHIELVYDLYWQAFEKLSKVPEIKTLEENDAFCDLVKGLLNDHLVVIPQLALGIMESSKHIPPQQVDKFMNKMLRSRISRRVLAEQHISLTSNFNSPNHMMSDRGYIGIIYTHCRPGDIVERTALLAAETCRQSSGGVDPPKVMLDGNVDAEFSYIPDHIEYILYELLKNSMRYVMQNGIPDAKTGELPPIQITVCEGTHDIVFRISDKGGGIHPDMEAHLWSYSQSPARFANFEKISKMAATVQEQMVSPSRSANLGQDDRRSYSSSSSSSNVHNNREEEEDDGEGIVLPPPPVSHQSVEPTPLVLDRHAPPRTNKSSSISSFSTSSSQHHQHTAASTTTTTTTRRNDRTIIDPSQNRVASQKPGHLDTAPDQYKDQSMHLGIGLPMSRVYAEYWGGDLKVFTMHGYGTDAYARFCKFGNIYENFDD